MLLNAKTFFHPLTRRHVLGNLRASFNPEVLASRSFKSGRPSNAISKGGVIPKVDLNTEAEKVYESSHPYHSFPPTDTTIWMILRFYLPHNSKGPETKWVETWEVALSVGYGRLKSTYCSIFRVHMPSNICTRVFHILKNHDNISTITGMKLSTYFTFLTSDNCCSFSSFLWMKKK